MTEAQKKRSGPDATGNRSKGYRKRRKKPTSILHQTALLFKRWNWRRILFLILAGVAVFFLLRWLICSNGDAGASDADLALASEEPALTYIFRDGDGYPVDMEHLTDAWAAEAGFEKRYTLTDSERWEIASVITAEAEGEPFAGKLAVAQCILQTCEDDGLRPSEALAKYGYSKRRPDPTEEALEAVEAVFDFGILATNEPIKYFYAPSLCQSDWHESQVYVMTINNHKFFKEASK